MTVRERQKIQKMAEPDKLNIDSIIQRLLEGKKDQTLSETVPFGLFMTYLHGSKNCTLCRYGTLSCSSLLKTSLLSYSVVGCG